MLHAVIHHKTGYQNKFLRQKYDDDEKEGYRRSEDELTSIIFGPLDFLPSNEVLSLCMRLIGLNGEESNLALKHVQSHECLFWKREEGIEPDLLIDFQFDGEYRDLPWRFIVEVKWNSGLSSEDQLQKQWQRFSDNSERKKTFHLFIGKATAQADAAIQENNVWEKSSDGFSIIKTLRWQDFQSHIHGNRAMQQYATRLKKFMDMISIRPFSGFSEIENLGNEICMGIDDINIYDPKSRLYDFQCCQDSNQVLNVEIYTKE